MALLGFFTRENKESLNKGLEKTKESVFTKLSRAVMGKSKVDDEVLDNLEEVLVSSDVGVETTLKIIKRIEARVAKDKYLNTSELNTILKEEIVSLLEDNNSGRESDFSASFASSPHVIMIVGVNGSGKTTTIAKLAYQYKKAGRKGVVDALNNLGVHYKNMQLYDEAEVYLKKAVKLNNVKSMYNLGKMFWEMDDSRDTFDGLSTDIGYGEYSALCAHG
jgi:hypothetical protein